MRVRGRVVEVDIVEQHAGTEATDDSKPDEIGPESVDRKRDWARED